MPIFRLKLGEHETSVPVPSSVKGLSNVADYICKQQANRFADGVTAATPPETYGARYKNNYYSWYDSHLDAITQLLEDLKDKLRAKHGRE